MEFDINKVISASEEELKLKTTEPIQCEPGEAVMYNWEGKENG